MDDTETQAVHEIATEDIPRERWPSVTENLSRLMGGWRVRIELIGRDIGDQPVLDGLPLQGLSFEPRGSDAGDILIEAGDEPDFMIHQVDHPAVMRIAHMRPGKQLFIQFESGDGLTTLVCLERSRELPPGRARPAPPRAAPREPSRRIKRTSATSSYALAILLVGAALIINRSASGRRALRAY